MAKRYTPRSHLALLGLALLSVTAESADFSLPDNVQIHGFLSQAYINTTDNNFFGNTTGSGSFDFREIGLNGSWRATPDLQFSLQLLSRTAGKNDDGRIRIDYGFADYTFLSNADNLFGIRAGRVTNPLGFYNDTRDVAFLRPSILLPQSIYFDRTRNLALSGDGAQFYGEHRTMSGDWFMQFNVGLPRVDDPDIERSFLGADFPGDIEAKTSFVGRLLYEKDNGMLRLALSGAALNTRYKSQSPVDPLNSGNILFAPAIFSAQYNRENWSITGEYALRRFEVDDVFANLGRSSIKFTGESYYLQGTYRFHPAWEGFVRYDVLYVDRSDRNGKDAETPLRPAYSGFAKDFTVGVRWDVAPSFMLRAEYHNVDGTAWLPFQDNPIPTDTERYWSLFTILGSYRF